MHDMRYESKRTGKEVQIIAECTLLPEHEAAVCYQELDGEKSVYVLTKEMFVATFSLVGQKVPAVNEEKEPSSVDKLLLFLDAGTYREKMRILEEMKGELNDHLLNNMAVSLDLSIEDGMDGYALIMSELKIRSRFEGKRGERL